MAGQLSALESPAAFLAPMHVLPAPAAATQQLLKVLGGDAVVIGDGGDFVSCAGK